MKGKKSYSLLLMVSILLAAAVACNTPVATATQPPSDPGQAAVVPTSAYGALQSGASPVDLPSKRSDQASDPNSSVDATKKQAPGGDTFVSNLFERPFNANSMDTYFPQYDIIDTQGFKDDSWGYATITLAGADADGKLSGKYGVELDLNLDGRGDWLILVTAPASTQWSTQGVQAWKDSNGDVGGSFPIKADSTSTGDGYETLIFDQGKDSSNPDGAFVRISPSDPNTVQLAFKLSLVGSPKFFAMGAWAGSPDVLNPAQFDFNDHMTHAQAGDPMPNLPQVYPLKALYEIDNTCRLAIGFAATGKEPGLCKTVIFNRQSEPTAPPRAKPTSPPPPPK